MFEDEKILTLIKPVEFGGTKYEQLTLREPLAGEIAKASAAATNTDVAINLISAVAKVPRRVVEQLCQRDFQAANDFLASISADGAEESGES